MSDFEYDHDRRDDYDDRDWPEDEQDERAPDDVIRDDNARVINDRLRQTW